MRNTTLIGAALALVLSACGGGAGDAKDGKDKKATTAKRDAKDAKKADAKKPDEKKADAKAEEPPPTTAAGEEPPPDEKGAEAELTDEKVVEVARAAKEIEAKPAEVDTILQSHGMDREQFDAAVATIAMDQWKSDLYIAAFTQAAS